MCFDLFLLINRMCPRDISSAAVSLLCFLSGFVHLFSLRKYNTCLEKTHRQGNIVAVSELFRAWIYFTISTVISTCNFTCCTWGNQVSDGGNNISSYIIESFASLILKIHKDFFFTCILPPLFPFISTASKLLGVWWWYTAYTSPCTNRDTL